MPIPLACSSVARVQRDLHLRAGGEQDRPPPPLGLGQHIGAARGQVLPACARCAPCGRFCRVSASTDGALGVVSASSQASAVSTDVGRAEDVQVRRRAQHRQMLDRLVRRPVLAEADRVVRQHVDDPRAHQRRQPHRAAGIVGEARGRCRRRARTPPCTAMPFIAAAMPCSRMP